MALEIIEVRSPGSYLGEDDIGGWKTATEEDCEPQLL